MNRYLISLLLLGTSLTASCARTQPAAEGAAGPVIDTVTASTNSFSIDCAPTSITVTAHITDPAGVAHAQLSYRVGNEGPYISVDMLPLVGEQFSATVKGTELAPDKYGNLEFYVAAEDKAGNRNQSPTDSSVQFLPCVSH